MILSAAEHETSPGIAPGLVCFDLNHVAATVSSFPVSIVRWQQLYQQKYKPHIASWLRGLLQCQSLREVKCQSGASVRRTSCATQ